MMAEEKVCVVVCVQLQPIMKAIFGACLSISAAIKVKAAVKRSD